jgi:hypothetical protein
MKRAVKRIGKWGGIGLGVVVLLLTATYFVVDWTRPSLDEEARAELLRDGRAKQFVRSRCSCTAARSAARDSRTGRSR